MPQLLVARYWMATDLPPIKKAFWQPAGDHEMEGMLAITGFADLEGVLPQYAMSFLEFIDAAKPTSFQAQVVPFALAGYNVNGVAPEQAGKLLACTLICIARAELQPQPTRVLIAARHLRHSESSDRF